MEEKPLIDPVWRQGYNRVWRLHLVGADPSLISGCVASVDGDGRRWRVWTEIAADGFAFGADKSHDGRSACQSMAAAEDALRQAGLRFAGAPPRGSMTRGLPLADELDPATYLPYAIAALHGVLKVGAERYPDERWKTQNVAEHLRHAREHIRLHTIGDESEPHLRHALTRLAFAVEIAEGGAK